MDQPGQLIDVRVAVQYAVRLQTANKGNVVLVHVPFHFPRGHADFGVLGPGLASRGKERTADDLQLRREALGFLLVDNQMDQVFQLLQGRVGRRVDGVQIALHVVPVVPRGRNVEIGLGL